MKRVMIGLAVWMLAAGTARAQQRPLATEDPETLTTGLMLIEAGFDHLRDIYYPLSGLQGNLTRFPTIGVSVGIGPIAEVQIDGGLFNRLSITSRKTAPLSSSLDFTGDTTTDVEDIVVATKIKVLSESASRPAIGLRLATKLPNASNESGLGKDTTDFFGYVLVGKTVRSVRIVTNVGLGILGDPIVPNRQDDIYAFGASVARAVREGVELVGEVDVRANFHDSDTPNGNESRGRMVFGGRITKGTVRVDSGLVIGMTSRDPSFGITAGVTWVFTAFRIP